MNRFNNCAGQPTGKRDFADDNRCWEYLTDVLKPLGLCVIVVETSQNPQEAGWSHVGNIVGAELQRRELGAFDSCKLESVMRWWFIAVNERLAEALNQVKSTLAEYKLLQFVKIGHSDAHNGVWRTFHHSEGQS